MFENIDNNFFANQEEQQQEIKENTNDLGLQVKLENEIINFLIKAEKKHKEFFISKWDNIKKYSETPINARWVSMIINAKIVSASENILLLLFDHEPSANILNLENKNIEFNNFTYKIFNRDILILGVWNSLWEKIKTNFIKLKNQNKLPEYTEFVIPKAKLDKIKQNDSEELNELINYFGSDIVEEVK